MNIRLSSVGLGLVAFCVACAALLSSGAAPAQQPKDTIPALFDGLPADLRAKVQYNSVRRDRVNDWLSENVNGKGKTIDMQVPVKVLAKRAKDGTYLVAVTVGTGTGFFKGGKAPKGPPAGGGGFAGFGAKGGTRVNVLGDEWSLALSVGGGKDSNDFWPNQLELAGVNVADAEKLVDLAEATVKGKIIEVSLASEESLRIVLGDVTVDGKKMTPRKRDPKPLLGVPPGGSAK
jgi:hypothetical protein